MALILTVTDAGRAALVNAANTGTAAVTIAQVGISGTAVAPTTDMTALPGETRRIATLSGDVVADDTIHLIVRDESASVFTVRSFALYLADGTLFALYGQGDVILEKSAQAMMLLAIDVQFADIDAAQLTFGDANFLNPPATTERQGVVELATYAETIAGDTTRVPAAKTIKDAVFTWQNDRLGVGNSAIWHPGNDGAGSGLDADLLDGQHGSYYSNIAARLGYTPVQQGTGNGQTPNVVKIGWSAAGRLKATVDVTDQGNFVFDSHIADVWRASNDGAGSGLDADLLDGQDGSYYSNVIARLGYQPSNKAGDTFTGTVTVPALRINNSAGQSGLSAGTGDGASYSVFNIALDCWFGLGIRTYDGSVNGVYDARAGRWDVKAGYRVNGVDVWHGSNDGSGSGLDADLLDGLHAASFARVDLGSGAAFAGGVSAPYLRSTGTADIAGNISAAGISISTGDVFIARTNTAWGYIIRPNVAGYRNLQFACDGAVTLDNCEINAYNVTTLGNRIWNAGNDGAGSGLDSDMLDGLHASQFLRNYVGNWINSEEGTPRFHFINGSTTYARVTNSFVWQNSGNTNIALIDEGGTIWANGEVQALRFRARANGDGLAIAIGDDAWIGDVNLTNTVAIRGQQDGNAGYIAFGTSTYGLGCNAGDWTLRYAGNPIWHAGNDGSGSGLDADLLDGMDSSAFAKIADFVASKAQNGYCRLPNGIIMQWGRFTANPNGTTYCAFPIAFPNLCGAVTASGVSNTSTGAQDNPPAVYSANVNGFYVFSADDTSSATHFIAFGY